MSRKTKDLEENMTEKEDNKKRKKKISREKLVNGLRKEIRTLREPDGGVPFWEKPLTRDRDNNLGASPIMFLSKDIGEKQEPATKGMDRPYEKGFAPKYEELYKVFTGSKKVQGTPRLDNVASVLLDGLVYAKFMAGLGIKSAADEKKDTFAGGHGPFFLFMNEKKLKKLTTKKKKSERTEGGFYSVDVIDFVVVPDVEQKVYLLKILKRGLHYEFITESEMDDVEKKIYTYDEIIEKKTGKSSKKKKEEALRKKKKEEDLRKKKEEEDLRKKKKEEALKKKKKEAKKVKETVNVPTGRGGMRLERPKAGEEGYDEYINNLQKKRKKRKKKTNVEETPVNLSPVRPAAVALRRKRS